MIVIESTANKIKKLLLLCINSVYYNITSLVKIKLSYNTDWTQKQHAVLIHVGFFMFRYYSVSKVVSALEFRSYFLVQGGRNFTLIHLHTLFKHTVSQQHVMIILIQTETAPDTLPLQN